MTDQTHSDAYERRQFQPGDGRPVEPGMNRRAMLAGVGAVLAGTATVGATLPALSMNADDVLGGLVEAHRQASTDYDRALDRAGEVENLMVGYNRPRTPMSINADGTVRGGYHEVSRVAEADIRKLIAEYHQSLRMTYGSAWMTAMLPGFEDAMIEAINGAEQRAYGALEQHLVDYERRRAEVGCEAADAETTRTSKIEVHALASVWAYRPATREEREVKRAYLAEVEARSGATSDDDMTVEALMDILRNEVAA